MINKPEEHSSVPVEIADDEIILRSVDTRHFYKIGDKKPNIFMPPYGKTDVSVVRFRYMSATECSKTEHCF